MKSVKIENFNLPLFENVIAHSLVVSKSLLFTIKNNVFTLIAPSLSKHFYKTLTMSVNNFVMVNNIPVQEKKDDLDASILFSESTMKDQLSIPELNIQYNFGVMMFNADNIKKFLQTLKGVEKLNIEFLMTDEPNQDGLHIAHTMIFEYHKSPKNKIKLSMELTIDNFMSTKLSDFDSTIVSCKPSKEHSVINVSSTEIDEVKKMLKTLSGTRIDNNKWVTLKSTNTSNNFSDKVFDITFDSSNNLLEQSLISNIYRDDFLYLSSKNDVKIMIEQNSNKIYYQINTDQYIINCLSTNIQDVNSNNLNDGSTSVPDLDLQQYGLVNFGDGADDLPF